MTDPPAPRGVDERARLLEPLLYADAFDSAATLDEMWRFAPVAIGREALRLRLARDPTLRAVVVERDGAYALRDRADLLAGRAVRTERARMLERRARRLARALVRLPFVRGLALTGSAAAGAAGPTADVDLLVVVAEGRLGTAFLMLGSLARLTRGRLLCPNYYVSEARLAMPNGNLYAARELAQARALAGAAAGLHDANPWLAQTFPNAVPAGAPGVAPAGPRRPRRRDGPPGGRLGDRLEAAAARLARARLRAHYAGHGREVPPPVRAAFDAGEALRFHGRHVPEATLARLAARRRQVAGWLAQADRAQPGSTTSTSAPPR
jgi:hypothetical protein